MPAEEGAHAHPSRSLDLAAASRLLSAIDDAPEIDAEDATQSLGERGVQVIGAGQDGSPRLPGYVIEALIGEGASGRVYRARRAGSESLVAIKVLHHRPPEGWQSARGGASGARSAAARAWRELDLLQQIRLPCLPRVLDYGVAEGRLYIVMEFVEGGRLDRWAGWPQAAAQCAAQPDLRERARILADLADSVQALHEHGVIHRDIKPSNVIVNVHGQPVLIDLGIASLLAHDALETLTAEGAPIGSPAFMAPEQARGERARISTRTDVYALGASVLFTLTGRTPHDLEGATIHQAIGRVGSTPARSAREIDSALPRRLAAVVDKALSALPEDRYGSASEFGADLRRWLRGEPVEATPPGVVRRVGRWAGKHPVLATGALCGGVFVSAACLTVAATWWSLVRPDRIRFTGENKNSAQLLAGGGRVLRVWESNNNDARIFAQIVKRPRRLGGGRVVVTHVSTSTDPTVCPAQACIWKIDRLDLPEWKSPFDLQPPPGWRPTKDYWVGGVLVADIFPELPGEEVVVTHNPSGAPTAIRVYDLSGEVLYEAWHRGSIHQLAWLEAERILVVLGSDNFHSYLTICPERPNAHQYSTCLLGIQPKRGLFSEGLMHGPDALEAARPVWTKYLMPDEVNGIVTGGRLEVDGALGSQSRFRLMTSTIGDRGGVALEVDAAGNMRDRKRSDVYAMHFPEFREDRYELSDRPPEGPEAPR